MGWFRIYLPRGTHVHVKEFCVTTFGIKIPANIDF